MNNIYFENISVNNSPMNLTAPIMPEWQREVMTRVSSEYVEQAIETAEEYRAAVLAALEKAAPGYLGTAIEASKGAVHRFAYIKHIRDDSSKEYEAEIDLLLHTVRFCEV